MWVKLFLILVNCQIHLDDISSIVFSLTLDLIRLQSSQTVGNCNRNIFRHRLDQHWYVIILITDIDETRQMSTRIYIYYAPHPVVKYYSNFDFCRLEINEIIRKMS